MFAVVRHPDVAALGTIPDSALAHHRVRGWYRISDWREQPSDFHLPDFAEAVVDLDAPQTDSDPVDTDEEQSA